MSYHPVLGIRASPSNLILQRPHRDLWFVGGKPLPSRMDEDRASPSFDHRAGRSFGQNQYQNQIIGSGMSSSWWSDYWKPAGWKALRPCEYTVGSECIGKHSCKHGCYECRSSPGFGEESHSYCNAETEGAWMTGYCPGDSTLSCPNYKFD